MNMLDVRLLLADFAQVSDGKLTVVGAGWSHTGPEPAPSALAALIDLPWSLEEQVFHLRFELIDADGHVVSNNGDAVTVDAELRVAGVTNGPAGESFNVPFALNLSPLPLQNGTSYSWVFYVDGKTRQDWRLSFHVRS